MRDLHPLQEAFVVHGATQCGFCTPGFIMQAKTLLDENADPSDDEIKHCLKDTFCRCTGYTSIISAVNAPRRRRCAPARCPCPAAAHGGDAAGTDRPAARPPGRRREGDGRDPLHRRLLL